MLIEKCSPGQHNTKSNPIEYAARQCESTITPEAHSFTIRIENDRWIQYGGCEFTTAIQFRHRFEYVGCEQFGFGVRSIHCQRSNANAQSDSELIEFTGSAQTEFAYTKNIVNRSIVSWNNDQSTGWNRLRKTPFDTTEYETVVVWIGGWWIGWSYLWIEIIATA